VGGTCYATLHKIAQRTSLSLPSLSLSLSLSARSELRGFAVLRNETRPGSLPGAFSTTRLKILLQTHRAGIGSYPYRTRERERDAAVAQQRRNKSKMDFLGTVRAIAGSLKRRRTKAFAGLFAAGSYPAAIFRLARHESCSARVPVATCARARQRGTNPQR